jgi:hypothetical protein
VANCGPRSDNISSGKPNRCPKEVDQPLPVSKFLSLG